jgi:pyruvate dehydrogenase E2 component (dihydrolipoamide acetyltransferase)
MAEKIFMIALSPTMEEGTILNWSKKEGDSISTGDVICEVETDKASMDYESAQEGVLLKIIKGEGSGAKVGDTIGIIGEKGEDIADLVKEVENEAAAPAPAGESKAPAEEAAAPAAQQPAAAAPAAAEPASTQPAAPAAGGRIIASPLALKMAAQKGIDISRVSGSGPGGRIVKRDIENFIAPAPGAASAPARASASFAPAMAAGEDREIPVTGKRAVIAKRLAESMFSAVHYYVKNKVAMDNLMAARAMLNKEAPDKVSFNAFMLKFVAEALKRYPAVNASWQGDKILEFGSIDIGLAVDLGNGLITPIVRNVGNKGVVQIDAELKELIKKAGDGSLKPEEYTGATFSISNLGSFGVDEFTAVINPPGSAILALGKVTKTPVYDQAGNIVPVSQMVMTMSFDHRVIDGALGGRFLSELQRMMENPVRVLF